MAKTWYSPIRQAARWGCYILCHAVVTCILLVATRAASLVDVWMGDPKLFDVIPWRWIIDAIDVVIVGEFLVYSGLEAARIFREQDDD